MDITYIDTLVVPVAAFAGPAQFQLDCEYPDGTPRISSASVPTNSVGGGPYIPTTGYEGKLRVRGSHEITIESVGTLAVTNPNYCNPAAGACPAGADLVNNFVNRDYGFGPVEGTLSLEDITLTILSWTNDTITASLPDNLPVNAIGGRQLTVTRSNGQATTTGITIQVGLRPGSSVTTVTPGPGNPLQTAINNAGTNDLILVAPGQYNELVVMWKPVQLQGWGAGSTVINATHSPAEKVQDWRTFVAGLQTAGSFDLLPGQGAGFTAEEGAGIFVVGKAAGPTAFNYKNTAGRLFSWRDNQDARIDGFTINNSSIGGAIVVNGYGDYLDISNNRISNNTGFFGGGIRVGHPELVSGDTYTDSDNDFVSIRHNQVMLNGGLGGAGGGIAMCTGSDSYQINQNWICGNFSQADAGGIGHIGVSNNGLIENNTVIFNESFFQGQTVSGGGIFISGAAPLAIGGLSDGTGNVQILSNLIQANSAGAGDGGGIRLARINGADVAAQPADSNQWYGVDIMNNMIVNNVAGLAGGGISLQDAVKVNIVHNTIANNDSLATAGEAFTPGSPNQSTPQPGAGLVTRAHSTALAGIAGAAIGSYSIPTSFSDNIVWQNRQFYFWVDATSGCIPGDPACTSTFGICPDLSGALACPTGNSEVFNDVAIIGSPAVLTGTSNLFTPALWTPPGPADTSTLFVEEYFNGGKSAGVSQQEATTIQTPAAFDEGGNWIRINYGPLTLFNDSTPADGNPGTLYGDYHILPTSDAYNAGSSTTPTTDIDGDNRTVSPDIGADETLLIAPASIGNGSAKKGKGRGRIKAKRTKR